MLQMSAVPESFGFSSEEGEDSVQQREDGLDSLAFLRVFWGSKNQCKNGAQKVIELISKRDPKRVPKSAKWAPKAIPKQCSQKNIKNVRLQLKKTVVF